jgi:hypothetical protein
MAAPAEEAVLPAVDVARQAGAVLAGTGFRPGGACPGMPGLARSWAVFTARPECRAAPNEGSSVRCLILAGYMSGERPLVRADGESDGHRGCHALTERAGTVGNGR